MKIITLNCNGIRAAARKGFFAWLAKQQADVVCLQETKAQMEHLDDAHFRPNGYHCHFVDAHKKGYSGVGLYSLIEPKKITTSLGWVAADTEGRYIEFEFKNLTVASLYLPSGSSGDERQAVKFDFLDRYEKILKRQVKPKKPIVICGDWNIVHKKIDIKNWSGNQKNSGCLPEERAWMEQLFSDIGFVDAFRVVNQAADQYTWWSNRGQAWAKNVGWRIDYQVIHPSLKSTVKQASIYKKERFSDHAPLIIEYDFEIEA